MKSLICMMGTLAIVVAAGLASQAVGAADDSKPDSIEKIMETLHKGKKSALSTLKVAVKSESPDWSKIKKETKTYSTLAADLPKFDPPKGDSASFKKLAKTFASNAKALDTAAKKEDLTETRASLRKLGGSCMDCHEAHKPD
jgi:cytochrome c556